MKVKYFLLLILVFISLLTACNQSTSVGSKQVQTKEGYIVDIIDSEENYSILFYESSENKLSTITCAHNERMENINELIQGFRRSKDKVIIDISQDNYLIHDIKECKPFEKDISNHKELNFNLLKGERLSKETEEGTLILKICYPHYYFNCSNYENGEYIPDKKMNSVVLLEYFMWLNEWEDYKYLTPNKMDKHFAQEYNAEVFLKKVKEFFPHISTNALDELPICKINDDNPNSLFYELQKNVLIPINCGIGGAGILYPILREIDYIDKNTLRFILMDKSLKKSGTVDEWEYIVKLKGNNQWEFERINYIEP